MEEHEYRAMFEVEKSHWWFVSRRTFVRTLLRASGFMGISRKPAGVLKIADIGAGTGGMIPFLRQYGRVIGVEPSMWGRSLAKKRGIILRKGSAEHTGLATGSMDMVCFFDVLYHRGINDIRALSEAKRLLRPGGWLVVSDCALPWLTGPHDRAVQGRERYTVAGMDEKIRGQGFIVRKKTYLFFLLFPFVAGKRITDRIFANGEHTHSDVRPAHWFVNTVFIWLSNIEALGLSHISYPWGSSLMCIARKKGGV